MDDNFKSIDYADLYGVKPGEKYFGGAMERAIEEGPKHIGENFINAICQMRELRREEIVSGLQYNAAKELPFRFNNAENELLLRFMCECQPYGMLCDVHGRVRKPRYVDTKKGTACFESEFGVGYVPQEYPIEEVKPYVRPLKSLTEEEFSEIKPTLLSTPSNLEESLVMIDKWSLFVRRKHIDYLGLLEKGLGVSTETFNPYE